MSNTNHSTKPINLEGSAPLLSVFNMPASVRFYRDLLGFDLVQTDDKPERKDDFQWALLRLNGIELMLEPRGEKSCPKPITANAWLDRHDMSIYFGCKELDKVYTYLSSNGVDVQEPSTTSYGFKALYVRDPDGFLLVFHWPESE
ncbi:VOC family protein [Pedobacter sp. FW305-3-2-15-E-R2A2]|uniref:VOC family protein n=1 Tax=Pedobacter sp. FW305-3-2-15-E-R2A2 TaxID=3140251 RepID=UPI0031401427